MPPPEWRRQEGERRTASLIARTDAKFGSASRQAPRQRPRHNARMRKAILTLAGLVLIAPLVVASGPALVSTLRLAAGLRSRTLGERRRIVLDGYYAAIEEFERVLPRDAPIALVAARPADRDVAMFSVYHLYPRPARVFYGIEKWRRNDDGRGAEDVPARPEWVMIIDQSRNPAILLLRDDGTTLREVARH
jgi:hypothetical protein